MPGGKCKKFTLNECEMTKEKGKAHTQAPGALKHFEEWKVLFDEMIN